MHLPAQHILCSWLTVSRGTSLLAFVIQFRAPQSPGHTGTASPLWHLSPLLSYLELVNRRPLFQATSSGGLVCLLLPAPGTRLAVASSTLSAGRADKDLAGKTGIHALPPWSPALSPVHGPGTPGCMSQTLSSGPCSAPVPSTSLPSSGPPTGPQEITGTHFLDREN